METFEYFSLLTSFFNHQFCTVEKKWIKNIWMFYLKSRNFIQFSAIVCVQVWLLPWIWINKRLSRYFLYFGFTEFDDNFWLFKSTVFNKPETLKGTFSNTLNKYFLRYLWWQKNLYCLKEIGTSLSHFRLQDYMKMNKPWEIESGPIRTKNEVS